MIARERATNASVVPAGAPLGESFDGRDAARLLESLVRIPSLSRDEGRAARFFAEALAQRGFEARIDAAGNAVAEIGSGDSLVALVGHIDTVPGALPVEVRDGVLFGRGAVDAKGPLVTLASAAARAVRNGARARFLVVGCVEEEAPTSRGARHLIETLDAPPDALVVGEPSAWDGVTLGYKGYLRAALELERASAHGAHEAATAAEDACAAWRRIERGALAFDLGRETLFDRLMPALHAIECEHDGLRDRARLEVSLRLPLDLSQEQAAEWLARRAPDASMRVHGSAPAWRGPRTGAVARALGRAILTAGGKPRYQVKTGTADLNLLAPAWGCPAVAYGPGDAALDHTPDERIELAEVDRAADVLTAALIELAARPASRGVQAPHSCSARPL